MSAIHVRWALRADMPAMLAAECVPPEEREFREHQITMHLRQRNCISMVAEFGGDSGVTTLGNVAGFMIYELHAKHLHLAAFAVRPEHRREGVGRALAAKLKFKMLSHGRERITADFWDDHGALLFARAMRFKPEKVLYHETPAEGDTSVYRFAWAPSVKEQSEFNRAPYSMQRFDGE